MKKSATILLIVILALALVVGSVYAKPNNPHRKAGNALPDQDGKGMDRGLPESDKEEDGGDWNNGCGNESDPLDREDDNNGRCGRQSSTATPTPVIVITVTPTPVVTPTERPTITICWKADTPEIWDEQGKFLDEAQLLTEGHGVVCWTAERGRIYYILEWTPKSGHAGAMYSVPVRGISPGVYFPQRGDIPYSIE